MAKIPNGILGPVIGRIGPLTGFLQNGEGRLNAYGRRKDKKITEKRLAQRQKLKVCNEFTLPFAGTGFFQKSFPAYGHGGTGYNRATAAIMNQAITGKYPDTSVAYPLVLISRGQLPGAVNASAQATPDGNIRFTWTNNTGTGTAKETDIVILVAYFPEETNIKSKVITSVDAAKRENCEAILKTNITAVSKAETWIGFISAEKSDASDSVYTGSITL